MVSCCTCLGFKEVLGELMTSAAIVGIGGMEYFPHFSLSMALTHLFVSHRVDTQAPIVPCRPLCGKSYIHMH